GGEGAGEGEAKWETAPGGGLMGRIERIHETGHMRHDFVSHSPPVDESIGMRRCIGADGAGWILGELRNVESLRDRAFNHVFSKLGDTGIFSVDGRRAIGFRASHRWIHFLQTLY